MDDRGRMKRWSLLACPGVIHSVHGRLRDDPRANNNRIQIVHELGHVHHVQDTTASIDKIIHKMDPAIARAVFTSALLRADTDAPEIRREDAASFTKALIKVINICSNREMKVRVD
jgi:hypothetical protein